MRIAIASLEVRNSPKNGEYAYGRCSILRKDGTVIENRVLMSFGPQFESVRDILVEGATVNVNAMFEKGTVNVLSPYAPKATSEARAT